MLFASMVLLTWLDTELEWLHKLHCYGHSLNLAMSDTIKGTKLLRDSMDVTHEISKLIKYSPKRNVIFACCFTDNSTRW